MHTRSSEIFTCDYCRQEFACRNYACQYMPEKKITNALYAVTSGIVE